MIVTAPMAPIMISRLLPQWHKNVNLILSMRREKRMDTQKTLQLQFSSRQVIVLCFWTIVTFLFRCPGTWKGSSKGGQAGEKSWAWLSAGRDAPTLWVVRRLSFEESGMTTLSERSRISEPGTGSPASPPGTGYSDTLRWLCGSSPTSGWLTLSTPRCSASLRFGRSSLQWSRSESPALGNRRV